MRDSTRWLRLCTGQVAVERHEDRNLALQDLARGLRGREPRRAVDFRELLHLPRLWRPRHLERVALQLGGVDVAFHRPDLDRLGARLAEAAEADVEAFGPEPRLLG